MKKIMTTMALLAMVLFTASAQIKMKVTMNGPQEAITESGETVKLDGTLILPYDAITSIEYFRETVKGLHTVDLGLPSGTLWANFNFGATDSTEVGTQLAWADLSQIGETWGTEWTAPTEAQMQELFDNCDWEKRTDDEGNILGYLIYSQSNDNTLFLPFTRGYKTSDGSSKLTDRIFYWTGTKGTALFEDNNGSIKIGSRNAEHLLAVRPVYTDAATPTPGPGPTPSDPTVTITLTQTGDPTQTGVTYQLFFTGDYDKIVACGLYYATSEAMLTTTPRTAEGTRIGQAANVSLSGLTAGTVYYVKAFAKLTGVQDFVYSNVMSFKTESGQVEPGPGDENYPTAEYVDLGTSVKWAKWNMGAKSVSDYGKLFGWGVLDDTKVDENSISYGQGTVTNSSIAGDANYDVATAKWGTGWSVPTRAQFNELKDKCAWEYVQSYNGVPITGFIVKGKGMFANNHIFLPLAGLREFGNVSGQDEKGYYWSCENTNTRNAYRGLITLGAVTWEVNRRDTGCSIRPVYSGGDDTPVETNDETLKGTFNSKGAYVPNEGVDLGIKNQNIKWAQWNVGATSYGAVGNYYSWGDTESKASYSEDDYTLDYGNMMGGAIGSLDAAHDVARQQWGRKWRMPTWAEFKALLLNAQSKEWVAGPNGTHGLRVTCNGKTLYFPAGGFNTGTEPSTPTTRGCYWSNTAYNDLNRSYYLNFVKTDTGVTTDTPQFARFYGLLVRPVWDETLDDLQ